MSNKKKPEKPNQEIQQLNSEIESLKKEIQQKKKKILIIRKSENLDKNTNS